MNNNDKLIENVSFAVYESAMIRAERHIKRLWISLVVCIISMAVMTIGFFYYLSLYDFASYEQDGSGVNIVGNKNGVDFVGSESAYKTTEERQSKR